MNDDQPPNSKPSPLQVVAELLAQHTGMTPEQVAELFAKFAPNEEKVLRIRFGADPTVSEDALLENAPPFDLEGAIRNFVARHGEDDEDDDDDEE